MTNFVVLTADELEALGPLERQVARRAAREQPLVGRVLRAFVEHGGPIPVEDLLAARLTARRRRFGMPWRRSMMRT